MKRNRLFLIIATAVALGCMTTSCSQDTDIAVAPNDGDFKTPISFNVGIGSLPAPQVETRGSSKNATTVGYVFANGDKVCIAVLGKGSTSRSTSVEDKKIYKVESANTDAGNTTGTAQALVYDGAETDRFQWLARSEQVSVRAWGFGDETTTDTDPDGAEFTINTDQSGTSTHELLYSPSTDNTNPNDEATPLNILLYHQLARVVVNVTGTIPSDVTVSGVQIGTTTNKVPTKATFTKPGSGQTQGTWSSPSTPDVINAKAETIISPNMATYSAVVIPYNGQADGNTNYYQANHEFIQITTTRGTYTHKLASNLNIQPGKQYTFTITNLNQIDLNVTVTAWIADTTNSEDVTFSN